MKGFTSRHFFARCTKEHLKQDLFFLSAQKQSIPSVRCSVEKYTLPSQITTLVHFGSMNWKSCFFGRLRASIREFRYVLGNLCWTSKAADANVVEGEGKGRRAHTRMIDVRSLDRPAAFSPRVEWICCMRLPSPPPLCQSQTSIQAECPVGGREEAEIHIIHLFRLAWLSQLRKCLIFVAIFRWVYEWGHRWLTTTRS